MILMTLRADDVVLIGDDAAVKAVLVRGRLALGVNLRPDGSPGRHHVSLKAPQYWPHRQDDFRRMAEEAAAALKAEAKGDVVVPVPLAALMESNGRYRVTFSPAVRDSLYIGYKIVVTVVKYGRDNVRLDFKVHGGVDVRPYRTPKQIARSKEGRAKRDATGEVHTG